MDRILMAVAAVFALGVFGANVRAIIRWRGPRRFLAVLVLLGAVGWEISIAIAIRQDPTSHNLWPIESVVVAGAALSALVTIGLVRSKKPAAR